MTGSAWLPDDVEVRSRLLALPWGRVFACDVGSTESSEPPLCLLHGLLMTHHVWSDVIPKLASGRRVIALDLPGCGDSDHPDPDHADGYSPKWLADAVLRSLAALDAPRIELCGHNYGGAVALALASAAPERISRLVLCDALALGVSPPLPGTLSIAPSLGPTVFRRAVRRADIRRYLEVAMSTPELVRDSDVDVFWDRLCRRGAREAAYAMLGQMPGLVRLRDALGRTRTPALVVWGDRDTITPIAQGEKLASLLPDATLRLIDGCGHVPPLERPDELVAAITEQLP